MPRGFSKEACRKGGLNMPAERRSFFVNKELAREAGRKGGRNVKPQDRTFSKDRLFAQSAGRRGGIASALAAGKKLKGRS